jgi:cytochrome c
LKNILVSMMLAVTSLVFTAAPVPAAAAERGTLEDAKVLVKKALVEFDKRDGQFVDRDMYIYVYDKNLKNLAHGGNAKLIGKDLADMRDPDGRYVNKGLLEAAQKGGGTYTFKFFNPVSGKIESKTGYAEMEGDLMVGSGVYVEL